MPPQYLGHVNFQDPIFTYLSKEIYPSLGAYGDMGIRAFRLNGSNAVYLYEDCKTCQKVIGKFFLSARKNKKSVALRLMNKELSNLNKIRSFLTSPHYVARPLGSNSEINCLLIVEYCTGEPLDQIIYRAINQQDDALLYQKLTALAYFMSSFHNRSVEQGHILFNNNINYVISLIRQLLQKKIINDAEEKELLYLIHSWNEKIEMWQDNLVFVHGDATPSNFLFGDHQHVISFDLERGHYNDRVFDIGRMAAELFHFFLQSTKNKYCVEPFIGHFLWEYACHFPDRNQAFQSITQRVPFYMGATLLRIARNSYLDWNYQRLLIEEAKQCLRRGK